LIEEAVMFGDEGLFYNFSGWGIRTESLNELPDDLRALFLAPENVEEVRVMEVEARRVNEQRALAAGADRVNIVVLTEAEIAEWRVAASPYREAAIAELEAAHGPVVRVIFNRVLSLIAEFG
jgi:hypothetical protein